MSNLQKNLDFLLDKYSVENKIELTDKNTVVKNGKEYFILSHRNERRFVELKNIVNNGTLVGVSVMRVASIIEKDEDIYKALLKEFDLCQWILSTKIVSVTAMENGNVLNVIATTKEGIVCTIEISATLKKGEKSIDKHEIISQRGIACDVVVDAQLKQDSVYVFGKENKKFTDVDFELYGLSIEDIATVRCAFEMAQKSTFDKIEEEYNYLSKLVEMTKESLKNGERVVL